MNLVDLPMDAVTVKADHPVTTSLRVAEIFGKQHGHVLRDIRDILSQVTTSFGLSNFGESSYPNEQGKSQPMFELTRDGFTLLAMGFTGSVAMAFKQAYIERFNAMEAQLHHRATIGLAIPPVLTLAGYLETRARLNDLRAEVDALFDRLGEVEVRCKPAEIEEMTANRVKVGRKVHIVSDICNTLEAHGVPREVAREITGHDSNTVRQHIWQGKKS